MNKIPYVVEYVVFDPYSIPPEIKKSEDLKRYILSKVQGSPVELIESNRIALSMFIFNVMHQVCPEVVLASSEGSKYLIYSHIYHPIFHPSDVNELISVKNDFNMTNVYTDHEIIDLERIWRSSYNQDFEGKLKESLAVVRSKIKRTYKATFVGDAPLLFVLAAQHLFGNNTKQLFYQRNE